MNRGQSEKMMNRRHNAFTLIEALIIVIIMGVLAASIIPQFSNSTKEAKMSNLKFNLRIVRSQLEMYKGQHAGAYPPAVTGADFKNQLTQKTDENASLDQANGACGPYIEGDMPINPFNNSTSVAILKGNREPSIATGSADGWQYNPKHGWFYPNNAEYFQGTGSFGNSNQ